VLSRRFDLDVLGSAFLGQKIFANTYLCRRSQE
jgi:hypothetical protein